MIFIWHFFFDNERISDISGHDGVRLLHYPLGPRALKRKTVRHSRLATIPGLLLAGRPFIKR